MSERIVPLSAAELEEFALRLDAAEPYGTIRTDLRTLRRLLASVPDSAAPSVSAPLLTAEMVREATTRYMTPSECQTIADRLNARLSPPEGKPA